MTEHARWRPSSFPYLAKCPGFLSGPPGEAAERGTAIDRIVSALLLGDLVEVPPELEDQVEYALAAVAEARAEFGGTMYVQRQVMTPLPGCWGTADVVILDEFLGRAIVPDVKSGWSNRGPVEDHLQLLSYAAGICQEFDLEEVSIWLIETDRRQTHKATLSRGQLLGEKLQSIAALIKRVQDATEADYAAGDHCRYCVRAVTCPAAAGALVPAAEVADALRERDIQACAHAMAPLSVGEFLDRYRDQIELAKEILGAVEARARALHEAGIEIPGWAYEAGRKTRKWQDGAAQALRGALGDLAFTTEPKTPAQVEKLRCDGVDVRSLVKSLAVETSHKKLVKSIPALVEVQE